LSTETEPGTRTGHLVRPEGGGIGSILRYNLIADRRYVKVSLLSQLVAPILYLLALGLGLGGVVNHNGGNASLGTPYLTYIAPALIAATALQVGVGDATYPILHGGFKYQRIYFAMNAAPLTASQIARAILTWIAYKAAGAALIYYLIVACFGGLRSIGSILILPVATLGALAIATPIAAYSATIEDEGGSFNVIFRFIVMPMFLFSGTFYPITSLPGWVRVLAWISPLWHATELSRWVALGPLHLRSGVGSLSLQMAGLHLLFLVVPAVVGAVLAVRKFQNRLGR